MQWCYKCKNHKEDSEFYKDRSRKSGYRSACKSCGKVISKEHKRRKAEREGREMKIYQPKNFNGLSEEELLSYLRLFKEKNGRPPTSIDLDKNPDYPTYATYFRRFKKRLISEHGENKWFRILKFAGLEPIDYDRIWKAWEYIVEEIVELLYDDYAFQVDLTDGYRPDAVIENEKLIIDAATSNYDAKHKVEQFEAAKKAGYKVQYWCLYKTTLNGIDEEGLTYLFADDIKEKLIKIGKTEYIEKINRLLTKHDDYAKEIEKHRQAYIVKKIKLMAEIKGRTPKYKDFEGQKLFPSGTKICTWFGSFNAALQAAGLEINQESTKPHDPIIAYRDLLNFIKKHDRLPTTNELGGKNTTYTYKVYKKYGGIHGCLKNNGFDVDEYLDTKQKQEYEKNMKKIIKFHHRFGRYPVEKELTTRNNLPTRAWMTNRFKPISKCYEQLDSEIKTPVLI